MHLTQNEMQLYLFLAVLALVCLIVWAFVSAWEHREERARTERIRRRLNHERAEYYMWIEEETE